MFFKNFSINNYVKNQLDDLYHSNRVPHALLLNGQEGSGHFQFGLYLAKLLLCKNTNQSFSFQHPDLHFSFPIHLSKTNHSEKSDDQRQIFIEMLIKYKCIGKSTWYSLMGNENKQGVIGVKESQEVLKKLSLKSYEGGAKVLIMWLPEMMNIQSANKLLKLIEEPPAKTFFILISDNKEKLLPTISSRLQHIDVSPPSEEEIVSFLLNNFEIDELSAKKYSAYANGNLHRAINFHFNSSHNSDYLPFFFFFMRLCYSRNIADTIDWVNEISKMGREQLKEFLLYNLEMFRNCVIGHYKVDFKTLNDEEMAFLEKFKPYINHNNIIPLNDLINEAYFHVERNANTKILMLDVSIKIFKLLKNSVYQIKKV